MVRSSDVPFAAPGLIVSCQARPDNPLHGPHFMAAMARAAEHGGAVGIRANGPADIAAIRAATALPLIGLFKVQRPGTEVTITPDFAAAAQVARAGADWIAVDATDRVRPAEGVPALIARIHAKLGCRVLADVATEAEGVAAAAAGADAVATTLSGYTAETAHRAGGPDLDLVAALAAALHVPVVAEGRFWTPEQVAAAFACGARAVVVGTAITNPREITRRMAAAVPAA
jgi:putative N-acetylmannosamine-6-phosphate epimerase